MATADPSRRRLAEAHIELQRRLRLATAGAVGTSWRGLGSWDEADVPRFLELAVPVVLAAQNTSVALTEAYLARVLDRAPLGVDAERLIGAAVRNGTAPEEVYRRPFVNVWSALKRGEGFSHALESGYARATATAEMDVQLSMRATAGAVQQADEGIYGYERVADGAACDFCKEVDGAYVKNGDAMPLHNRCGCGLEPLTAPHSRAAYLPSGVAVHEHGELGPVLTDPAHAFTGPDDL